jgi:hypothetical protein
MTNKPLTFRKAKRLLNQCDDWVLFTSKNNNDETANLECATMTSTSWAILIDFATADENFYNALETILNTARDIRENGHPEDES